MKDALIHTKLQRPPSAPDILPRDRLIEMLDEGRQRLLTVISAPAGYGISTLARLRGQGQLIEIRAADLRFTLSEVAAFLTRMLDRTVEDTTAALLEAKTEGWATGLRLAGLYLQEKGDVDRK